MFPSAPTTSIFTILSLVTITLAQISTISLYIPGADTQSLIGGVIGTASSITTYVLQCVNPGEECGFKGQFTVTENAATAKYTIPAVNGDDGALAFTGRIDCSLDSTISAVCVESFGGSDANFPGQSTETYTGTDFQYMPVLLTAGAAAGSGSRRTPSSSVASTATTTSATGTSSQTSTATSTLRSGSGSESGVSSGSVAQTGTGGTSSAGTSTSTSTAGVPAVTGNKAWMVGGAAAVGVMALMG